MGNSDSPTTRRGNHDSQKWWWWLEDSIEWQKIDSREEAKACETQYIEGAVPMFNVQESTLSPWERLLLQVQLVWTHETNMHDCPECPFCNSYGLYEVMSPSNDFSVFVRHLDDELVLAWEVSCENHPVPVRYAMHMKVEALLVKFGCPRDAASVLIQEACAHGAPYENRMDRLPTLFDVLQNGSPACRLFAESK